MHEYVEYKPRKILNVHKHVDGGWFWNKYSAHPYIGCEHGCEYCYWRDEKYNMLARERADLADPFTQYIKVKVNAPELLRKELSRVPKDIVMLGDYQPAEARYGLSRKMLEVCLELEFPVMVLEKSPLVLRDIDLIKKINEKEWACVMFSIIKEEHDSDMERFEPNSPRIESRFKAMKEFSRAGILTGTCFMPILPFICDSDENLEAVVKKTAKSGGRFVLAGGLTMSDAQAETYMGVIRENYPELEKKYESLYHGEYSPADCNYSGRIGLKVKEFCQKYGIKDRMPRWIPEELAINKRVAEDLFNEVYSMELAYESQYRIWAYRKAAWAVDELRQDIGEIYQRDGIKGLKKIPGVGENIAKKITGVLDQNPYLLSK